ncbi:hypothetical protein HPE56_09835 [Maribacter sp. ANRC-HE7]|uniref:Glucosamine inositolphosphorylceramide transferase 1 N-terminal domain-containing protein n=1 Tax=Maribacter aquimaris TaxID=2737171 RepID=A0ABR7UZS2_9FLAO|nr:hypothetical protein [Maribacter aquimaris]MBD0778092.1 hypothetical protein [Maribacter aquimaris]
MRIGVSINELESLGNWELRIIEGIRKDPEIELSLIILDAGFPRSNKKNGEARFKHRTVPKWGLGEWIFKKQLAVERKFFFKKINTINKKNIYDFLNTCATIKLQDEDEKGINAFVPEDLKKIKAYDLDLLLQLGHQNIGAETATLAQLGVWSLLHSKNSVHHYNYIGFFELLYKEPAIEVALQQIGLGNNQYSVIDRAYFSLHWSLVKTRDLVLEGSVSLLLKNLRLLSKGINLDSTERSNSNSIPTRPKINEVLKYCIRFYKALTIKLYKSMNTTLFGANYQRWSLFLGQGNFLNTKLSKLTPTIPPKDEFWADPFLFRYGNQCYVFFETFCYKTKKGKLSCGILEEDQLTHIIDILDLDYHLSYPFVFEEEGQIYLMPETMDNKRLEIYKCIRFPDKWELYTTAFEGEMVADPSFYTDNEGQKWLFVNKKEIKNLPLNSELFIYKVDSIKLKRLIPHAQNPVIIDSRTGRNGGAVFSYGDEIYRPSQRNVDGIYGRALNINKIKELTINSYKEEISSIVEPDFHAGIISIHHLHQIEDRFVFDAAFKK